MQNEFENNLRAAQAKAVEEMDRLEKIFLEAAGAATKAKEAFAKAKEAVEQNARALKAYEPRKPRAKKAEPKKEEKK